MNRFQESDYAKSLVGLVAAMQERLSAWYDEHRHVTLTCRPLERSAWRLASANDVISLTYAELERTPHDTFQACDVRVSVRRLNAAGVLMSVEVTRQGHVTYQKTRWIACENTDQIERFLYAASLVVRTHFKGVRPERIYDNLFN